VVAVGRGGPEAEGGGVAQARIEGREAASPPRDARGDSPRAAFCGLHVTTRTLKGTAQGSVDSSPVRPRPRWKNQIVPKPLPKEFRRDVIAVAPAGPGIYINAGVMDDFDDIRAFRDIVDVNLVGVWHTVHATAPHGAARGTGGSIILTSSTQGLSGPQHCGEAAQGWLAGRTGRVTGQNGSSRGAAQREPHVTDDLVETHRTAGLPGRKGSDDQPRNGGEGRFPVPVPGRGRPSSRRRLPERTVPRGELRCPPGISWV
jgi:NAD(P)-dependent dehydrogenase (short-subunit alcohol dehydrogenase family)